MEFGSGPLFEDDEEDQDSAFGADVIANKEFLVYLIDAGSDMFLPFDTKDSYFEAVMKAVEENLKQRILARDDKVGLCFFNTNQKKNIQEAKGVYVWSELEDLSADLIRNFGALHENFQMEIGSHASSAVAAREHPLYDALWVVQAMLRSGSTKNVGKRVLMFTNNDDPFGEVDLSVKNDMLRTTIQRAKDAQDLGIDIDLIPLSRPGEEFNMGIFYNNVVPLEDDDDGTQYVTQASYKFEDLNDKLKKRLYKKRVVRKMLLTVASGTDIAIRTYAMIRPSVPASHTYVDSRDNKPLKTERTYICSDTGALMNEPLKRFEEYQGKKVVFSGDEVSEIKNVTDVQLRLLGFKPLKCLQQYHNLRPPTFIYPDDEAVKGSVCAFIALHRAMLRLNKYAVAFYGTRASSQLVALVAQDEKLNEDGTQKQPEGMSMIYLPYADDIRPAEKFHVSEVAVPRASKEQVDKAVALIRHIELKDFSVTAIPDPALQRHYATLQAVALDQDEENFPEIKDYTLPDSGGVEKAAPMVKAFKDAVYGEQHDDEEAEAASTKAKGSATAQKRKAAAEVAATEAQVYNWAELADTGKKLLDSKRSCCYGALHPLAGDDEVSGGVCQPVTSMHNDVKLKDQSAEELKLYLRANKLPVSGKKEILINRILSHLADGIASTLGKA